jgi:hypothetical protein
MVLLEGHAPPQTANAVVRLCLSPDFWQCNAASMDLSSLEFSQPRVFRKSFVPSSGVQRTNAQCIGRALVVLE